MKVIFSYHSTFRIRLDRINMTTFRPDIDRPITVSVHNCLLLISVNKIKTIYKRMHNKSSQILCTMTNSQLHK